MNKNPETHKRKKDSQSHSPKQDFNPNVYYPERTSETKVTRTQFREDGIQSQPS